MFCSGDKRTRRESDPRTELRFYLSSVLMCLLTYISKQDRPAISGAAIITLRKEVSRSDQNWGPLMTSSKEN